MIDANYAPLARFIECLTQVKNSSDLNNSALLQLIGLILKAVKIPEKLPTNFKKLFELYYELIAQYHTPLDQDTKAILQAWQTQFPTLKSVIQKILKQGV